MFEARQTNTMRRSLFSMLEVTYHASVQKVRSSHRNAVWAIMTSILQAGMFVGGFYLVFYFIGAREAKLHGDCILTDLGILRANHFALGDFIRAAHVQRHSDLP